MTKEEINVFVDALLDFIKRASKEGATAEEIAALPAVAQVLVEFYRR